jgi:DNA-binding HxlR family transcriptional regulator
MKPYGQFCSIAKALEIVGERWTLLVLRELICGSARFNEIQRGVPRMSPALLSRRLSALEDSGLIAKSPATGAYTLTQAGWELKPVVESLGVWGRRWVRSPLGDEDLDPDLLMWDMRRRIETATLPPNQLCICIEFSDLPEDKAHYWLLASHQGVDLCITDPGVDVDLLVVSDLRTLTMIWNGDAPLAPRIGDGSVELRGAKALRNAFPNWLQLNMFASVPPADHTG